jgi:hypothetical protein
LEVTSPSPLLRIGNNMTETWHQDPDFVHNFMHRISAHFYYAHTQFVVPTIIRSCLDLHCD